EPCGFVDSGQSASHPFHIAPLGHRGSLSAATGSGRPVGRLGSDVPEDVCPKQGMSVFPGCDRPSNWCQVHHLTPWSAGGASDLKNLALLCSAHHHMVHEGGWHLGPAEIAGAQRRLKRPSPRPELVGLCCFEADGAWSRLFGHRNGDVVTAATTGETTGMRSLSKRSDRPSLAPGSSRTRESGPAVRPHLLRRGTLRLGRVWCCRTRCEGPSPRPQTVAHVAATRRSGSGGQQRRPGTSYALSVRRDPAELP
ncbi:MAG: HNH endonuclease, partial [Acidimicrobiia bacterium]|nr:HNH endonuclease [Acidimicrobiia bacterium]